MEIIQFRPSNNLALSSALLGIENQLHEAALANVEAAGDGFTEAEQRAMTIVEEVRLINGMDLAAVLLRGKLLRQIEDEALYSIHPGGYQTLEEMARDQGISVSNLSNIRDLCFVIFPYMEQQMGISVAQVWEQIGMSNFRELIPVMKAIITGEQPDRQSAAQAVERILDDVAATAHAAGQELSDEEIRASAVSNLLNDASSMTNRELRGRIRPERTPNIEPTILRQNGARLVMVEMTEDQWLMFQRKLGPYMDPVEVNLPHDGNMRRIEASRLPVIRRIVNLLNE